MNDNFGVIDVRNGGSGKCSSIPTLKSKRKRNGLIFILWYCLGIIAGHLMTIYGWI